MGAAAAPAVWPPGGGPGERERQERAQLVERLAAARRLARRARGDMRDARTSQGETRFRRRS